MQAIVFFCVSFLAFVPCWFSDIYFSGKRRSNTFAAYGLLAAFSPWFSRESIQWEEQQNWTGSDRAGRKPESRGKDMAKANAASPTLQLKRNANGHLLGCAARIESTRIVGWDRFKFQIWLK